jgi:hypothetical protein
MNFEKACCVHRVSCCALPQDCNTDTVQFDAIGFVEHIAFNSVASGFNKLFAFKSKHRTKKEVVKNSCVRN